jgi:hypothetical protein
MLRTSSLILMASAGAALAHPGHETAHAQGAAHWLTDPSHWVVLALALLLAVEILRRVVGPVARRRVLHRKS